MLRARPLNKLVRERRREEEEAGNHRTRRKTVWLGRLDRKHKCKARSKGNHPRPGEVEEEPEVVPLLLPPLLLEATKLNSWLPVNIC